MKNPPYHTILTGLSLAFVWVACSPLAAQTSQTATEPPVLSTAPSETVTPVILPTVSPAETATPEPLPTATLVDATATSQYPPVCERSIASTLAAPQCQSPIAEQSGSFCMSKEPFNLVFLDPSASYELLDDGVECSEAGMKDGKRMLLCSGPGGTSFELMACSQPVCTLPTPSADLPQCRSGFWYDESQGCCAFIPEPVEQSCVTLDLQIKRCVTNCAEFIDAASCEEHYPACKWSNDSKACQVKK